MSTHASDAKCDWCRTRPATSKGFCSDECRNAWFDDDKRAELAYEAWLDEVAEAERDEEYQYSMEDML